MSLCSGKTRRFHFHAQSDVGLIRTNNEDALVLAPELGLFGICDGMGGHAAGEVASAMAANLIVEELKKNTLPLDDALKSAILVANKRIFDDQKVHPEHRGMGTTLSVVWLPDGSDRAVLIGHIGDSRIYRYRGEQLEQLTDDHTPVFKLYRAGKLNKKQIMHHPQRNLLDRSLGLGSSAQVDVFSVDVSPGDLFLGCTDGLNGLLGDDEIQSILNSSETHDVTVNRLISVANERGGLDNTSIVLLKILNLD
ncbi:MAG: PP2C family protein-serine/threonine phosphatase [Acidobacteriota bacterium]